MDPNQIDSFYIERALQLALEGLGRASPNPIVGAVVVAGDEIVGEGFHARAGEPHAEVLALDRAGPRAAGATLYVTLEPCCHQGRTPPCVPRVLKSGLRRVVVGLVDPNPLVNGEGIRQLREAGLDVEMAEWDARHRCGHVNRFFLKSMRFGLPFVTMKYAMTLDGKIATRQGDSQWISGEAAREWVHEQRNIHDAVMVGIGTVLADDPRLTTRLANGRDALRVIVDSAARTPLDSRILSSSEARLLVAVGADAPEDRVTELRRRGAEVLQTSGEGRVELEALMAYLTKQGVLSVLLEGGGRLNAALVEADLVDAVAVFVAPIMVGGEAAPSPLGGLGVATMDEARRLTDVQWRHLGKDVLFEGYLRPVAVA